MHISEWVRKLVTDKQWKQYAKGLWSKAEFDLRPRITEDDSWIIRYLSRVDDSSEQWDSFRAKIEFDITGYSHLAPDKKIHRQMTMDTSKTSTLRYFSYPQLIDPQEDEFAAFKLPPGNYTVSVQITPLLQERIITWLDEPWSDQDDEWTPGVVLSGSKKLEVVAKDVQLIKTTTDPKFRGWRC